MGGRKQVNVCTPKNTLMIKIKLPKEAELPKEEQPKSVIRIDAGKWYYIGRSLNFEFIETEMKRVYKDIMYKGKHQENNLFYLLVKKIIDNAIENVTVSILFKSDSGYAVLKEELKHLEINFGKRYCLNQNNIPHVPKFKTENAPSKWLTHNEFLNFKKLLTKYEY